MLVQDVEQAEFGSMPRGAIVTGVIELLLSVEKMDEALAARIGRNDGEGIFKRILPALLDLTERKGGE